MRKKFFLSIIVLLFIIFSSWFIPEGRLVILSLMYNVNSSWFIKDEEVKIGSLAEFSIKDKKSTVMSKLLDEKRLSVYIDKRFYLEGKFGVLSPLTRKDAEEVLLHADEWKIYLSKSSSDYVVFRFENDVLVSVRRYLKTLELP